MVNYKINSTGALAPLFCLRARAWPRARCPRPGAAPPSRGSRRRAWARRRRWRSTGRRVVGVSMTMGSSAPTPAWGQPSSTTTSGWSCGRSRRCVPVQRAQGPEVDHLGLDTLLRELIRRLLAEADHLAEAHQRDVRAGFHDESLADGRHVVGGQRLIAHRERLAVHQLVLEEDDGVRVANRGFE